MTSMSCSAASGCSLPCGNAIGVFSARAAAAVSSVDSGPEHDRGARLHRGAPAGSAPPATASIACSIGTCAMPLLRSIQP